MFVLKLSGIQKLLYFIFVLFLRIGQPKVIILYPFKLIWSLIADFILNNHNFQPKY